MKKRKLLGIGIAISAIFTLVGCSSTPVKGDKGEKGDDGVSVVSIGLTGSEGLVDVYTITYSDGSTTTFKVTNGADGEQGIQGEPGKDGLTPVISISDDNTWIINGEDTGIKAEGVDGADGIGIVSIEKTKTEENVDTYTITYSDGTTTEFTVTNGKDGAQGIKGEAGKDGHTPVIRIGSNGNWFIDGEDSGVSAIGISGYTPYIGSNGNWFIKDVDTGISAKGDNGKDGLTPHVGENGNWWIGEVDTGVLARGTDGVGIEKIEKTKTIENVDYYTITYTNGSIAEFTVTNGKDGAQGIKGEPGEDGHTPVVNVGDNGNWFVDGVDTNQPATGADGLTPYIGENGNWWIGDTDTNVKAKGEDGVDGLTPYIGEDGFWYIGEENTGVLARGKDGNSIVSILKTSTEGNVDTYTITFSDGSSTTFTVTNGKDGIDGIDGKPGEDGHTPTIEIGDNGNWFIDGKDSGVSAYGSASVYTVTLDCQGGTLPEGSYVRYQVKNGETILDLPEPTKSGYEFQGWFTGLDVNDGQFLTTTPVTKDLTLFAKWKAESENSFTVTWVNYDGRIIETDYDVAYGTYPSFDAETPTKPQTESKQYNFIGWSPDLASVVADTVYIAQFEEVDREYVVNFECGEYGSLTQNSFEIKYGEFIEEPSLNVQNLPDNIIFEGWTIKGSDELIGFPYKVTGDVTFVAKWGEIEDASSRLTYYYDETYDGYVVRSYNEDISKPARVIKIPETYNNGINGEKPVVGIEATFRLNQNLEAVSLPNSLKFIGDNAFRDSLVKKVNLPNSLEKIGAYAFSNSKIVNLNFYENLMEIEEYAFHNSPLSDCDLSQTKLVILQKCAFSKTNINSVKLSNTITTLGEECFRECKSLINFNLTESITTIKAGAFYACESIKEFYIPSSVINIEEGDYNTSTPGVFQACSNLEKVIIDSNITKIGNVMFRQCESLKDISLPNTIKIIGNGAFNSCYALKNIDLPDSIETFEQWCFALAGLETIKLPKNLKSIDQNVFFACSSLTSVTFNDGLETIETNGFYLCNEITSLKLPRSLKTIKANGIDMPKLEKIIISNSVETIEENAIKGSERLIIYAEKESYPETGWANGFSNSNIIYWYSEEEPTSPGELYWHYDENGDAIRW